ncbi:MAG: CoA transferase [Rhodoferax sp.]|nr:CoA transferase [Rhodoferax sp.]
MTDRMRPLDGVRVVSLEQAIAAPYCTRMLADLGARVIKVERPGTGDFARDYDRRARGLSSHFVWTNRGKESLTLDLKQAAALSVLDRLLAGADVLVQNLAPGAMDRLGLAHEALASRHPRLIRCDISGYGSSGPYRDRKAYDLLIQAEAGFLSVTGTPESPSKAGISVADIAAGVTAHSQILAALLLRARTGRGARIEVSMLEALAEWMGFPLYYTLDGAPAPARSGAAHASIHPYGPFRTGDGGTVMLGLQNEREWQAFCHGVMRDAALAEDARFAGNAARQQHREALQQRIDHCLSGLRADELQQRLDQAQIANARVNDLAGLWSHAQLLARERWHTVASAAGPLPALRPPGDSDAFEFRMAGIPAVGEHTQAILGELGLDDTEIAGLRASGAV